MSGTSIGYGAARFSNGMSYAPVRRSAPRLVSAHRGADRFITKTQHIEKPLVLARIESLVCAVSTAAAGYLLLCH